MKFNHTVKFNGEYYPPGTEVPMGDEKPIVTKSEIEEAETTNEIKTIKRGRPSKN